MNEPRSKREEVFGPLCPVGLVPVVPVQQVLAALADLGHGGRVSLPVFVYPRNACADWERLLHGELWCTAQSLVPVVSDRNGAGF